MEKMTEKTTCNHCGGKLTMNGDILSCLMCGREADHLCDLCIVQAGGKGKAGGKKKTSGKRKSAAKR